MYSRYSHHTRRFVSAGNHYCVLVGMAALIHTKSGRHQRFEDCRSIERFVASAHHFIFFSIR